MKIPLAIVPGFAIREAMRPLSLLLFSCLLLSLPSCESVDPQVAARNTLIAAEPRGDYFIGRRYHVDTTRFWGYVREPGQPWSTARLVIMNESRKTTPDRLPEEGEGMLHGYDNNHEYRIRGRYTGRGFYDPNSNLTLPEFLPVSFELLNPSPGFLFNPKERHQPGAVSIVPPGGIRQWP